MNRQIVGRIKITCWQLTLIVFFLAGSPVFITGLVVGFLWDMLRTGFFWGTKFIDTLIDKGEPNVAELNSDD